MTLRRLAVPILLVLAVLVSCSKRDERTVPQAGTRGTTSFLTEVASGDVVLQGKALSDSLTAAGTLDAEALALPSSRHYAVWSWTGRPHDLLRVTATAHGFEPEVLLLSPRQKGYRLLDETVAAKGEATARVVAETPASGTCLIAVAAPPGEAGSLTLRAQADSLPFFGGPVKARGAYALLAGAGQYPGADSDLPGAGSDLTIMKNLLVRNGFDPENILVLRDEEITRTRLIKAFREHLSRAPKNGLALFYYSGHGIQLNGNIGLTGVDDPEEDGKDEALLMANGSIILDDEIGYLADELHADRTLLILDSCYSGTGSRADVFQKAVAYSKARMYLDIPDHFLFEEGTAVRKGDGSSESRIGTNGHVLIAASQENQPAMVIKAPSEDAFFTKGPGSTSGSRFVSLFTLCFAEAASEQKNLTLSAFVDTVQAKMRSVESELGIDQQTPALQGPAPSERLRDILSPKR